MKHKYFKEFKNFMRKNQDFISIGDLIRIPIDSIRESQNLCIRIKKLITDIFSIINKDQCIVINVYSRYVFYY